MQRGGRNTRGVRVELPEEAAQEEQLDPSGPGLSGGVADREEEVREPTLSDLAGILRAHMGQQEARDVRWREESARQEQRFKSLQHQFQMLQLEVQARTSPTPEPTGPGPDKEDLENLDLKETIQPTQVISSGQSRFLQEPRLERLSETDDIEHFLITFERIAASCRWPKSEWVFRLIPLLTGKARSAYVHMDMDDVDSYKHVKEAILKKYDINPETYRQRFRSTDVGPGETPKELYVRLKELYDKWIQPRDKTVKEVGEIIILEQYLRMLSPELQVWIREHDPSSAAQAAQFAEQFVAARKKGQPWSYSTWKAAKDTRRPTTSQYQQKVPGGGKTSLRENESANVTKQYHKVPICYLCGQEGHTKPMCPKNPPKLTQMCVVPYKSAFTGCDGHSIKLTTVKINGKTLKALVDTGSVQTLVQRQFIPANVVCTSETIPICCVHGDERFYPTADIYMEVQGQPYLLNVGVADKLPFPVVLGSDLPVLFDLVQDSHICNIAVTRSQVRQVDEPSVTLRALPFYDADLDVQPGKTRKSRRQKRQEKYQHTVMTPGEVLDAPLDLKVSLNMSQMQHDDPNLAALLQEAKTGKEGTVFKSGSGKYVFEKGTLYHLQGSARKLVVPKGARDTVLVLAHSIPWAGHLGKHKTIARIRQHFYWPGLRTDVAKFCKTCPECQVTSNRLPSRAPLQPLPIISVPFQRLGMDIVGPLERSRAGNRYMLVITDYATKYPEVFPLKSIKAKAVAFSLVQLFSRVGFPCEIVTDQGSNFMSTLLKQVYQLLGIKGVRTTPYHPQTDGLTERFNQTLKQMLRKFVNEAGSEWDQWLPYLLFAYREVPQASTGFSPFELLYGHEVRGPLALLRETWTGEQGGEEADVVSYVVQMREKLEKMSELAQQHMAEAQKYQKTWYDRSARHRTFSPGQKVLVMLPSCDNKLLAKWQGPFQVVKQLGHTTYQVAIPGKRHSNKVLHVNLLKEWEERPRQKAAVLLIRSVEEEELVDDQYLPSSAPMALDLGHLSAVQQNQVRALCHPDIFQEYPGRTNIIEHHITLKEGAQVKRMSYRIPERLLVSLKKEVDLMLSLGIIEYSKSEWCNPVVLVPKKDSSIRFCIDFRYLNSVSKFDSYPTPRIDDIIERLGKAKYLTTIDLCKGYWQVPLSESSQELTAFRTPWGLFQFTVLPFGLHGAPATFQRLMDQVLNGCDNYACAYLDDIVIYSGSWEEHLKHLEEVLRRLQSAGLTINPEKCVLAQSETEYLGFVIGNGVIKPQVRKVHAIESCPLPRTRKQLRSFLGMAGFYQRFIPNFSARAAPLTDMIGSKCPMVIQWTKGAEAAFKDIQQSLGKSPVLHCPDFEKLFILQTDASERSIGAVLLQGPAEDQHPVAFISRKLFPRETRYSTVEKEALAIKWALDSLKYYLLGREFTLQTDHKALKWLQRMRDTNGRITRWYLAMQPFRFTVEHIPGKCNLTADYLSRWGCEDSEGRGSVMAACATTQQMIW
ncbi:uncharacterized protein LOC118561082 [Fundulus heteroclitus]|uniref:uncharacterized protein LOC118561082 n=1 Tax=Fundulus heteroclitus TaxID=8078 RepID=UPI00165A561B|nr:uncharacterized protein LOC118561082 [Fundulus heteroclitus]